MCSRSLRCRPSSLPDFERPILAARPYYGAARRAAAAIVAPLGEARGLRSSLLTVALCDCGNRRRRARPQRLHGRQALCVLSALGRDGGSRACARGASAAPLDRRGRGGGARLPFVRARAAVRRRSLSQLDRIAAGRDDSSADLFLPRRARQSDCVRDLVVLLSQRMDPGRRNKSGDRCARPAKEAALRPRSGSSGRMFDTTIHIDDLGLPRAGLAARQGRRLSHCRARRVRQTFGPTLRDGEKPWPEMLQASVRPSCVVRPQNRGPQRRNGGLYARGQS